MTTQRDSFLQDAQSIRRELDRLLEGLESHLDAKPNDEEWSAREIIYHIVETPEEGIHTAVRRTLEGSIQELPMTANLTNLTTERQNKDLTGIRMDVEAVLTGVERALTSTTDAELEERKTVFHSILRDVKEDRTAHQLTAGYFVRHWRDHIGQLAALRETLGLG
jgi:ElaB/YqjD/DUF883 family membrane-anchored ribosome-binding protein